MTVGTWPNAVPFDPGSGAALRAWEGLVGSVEAVPSPMLLVSGEAARYSGWSARTALELADALAGHRAVLLIDLHFDATDLGELAPPDREGISDVLLFGASLERVAVSPRGHRFSFIPTGPLVSDAEELLRSPAWTRVFDDAARSHTLVMGFVPWRSRGLAALLQRVRDFVFLGGSADARIAAGYLPADARALGVLGPASILKRPAVVRPPAESVIPTAAGAVTVTPSPLVLPTAAAAEAAAEPDGVAIDTAPPKWYRRAWVLVLALVVAGGLTLLQLSGVLRPDQAVAPQVPAPPAAAAPGDPGSPGGEALPYSVAIEAHQELATALRSVANLSEAEPAMGFYLAPILVDSVLYYRVMAGPVRDSASAAAVLQKLVDDKRMTSATDWQIRNTPLAFLLGVYDTRAAAEQRVGELAAQRIPAYVLEVPYSNGGARYHLYCGAYSGPGEADVMRQLLGNAGLETNLVERVGRTPS
jgi:hypothetical protein